MIDEKVKVIYLSLVLEVDEHRLSSHHFVLAHNIRVWRERYIMALGDLDHVP